MSLGLSLPDDYRTFLGLHNGQVSDTEPMVWTCALFDVQQLAERRRHLAAIFDAPSQSIEGPTDPAIAAARPGMHGAEKSAQ